MRGESEPVETPSGLGSQTDAPTYGEMAGWANPHARQQ